MPIDGLSVALRISLLGSFELEIKGRPVRLPTRKTEGLLAYLVLHRGVQNRERLAAVFWGDSTDELARRSLRTALSTLRKELGEDILISNREILQLNPEFSVWVDVYEMEQQIEDTLSTDPDIYRGDLLQDFYDEWVLEEREHYRKLFINAVQKNIQSLKANGEYKRAIALAQKIISIDSVNEQAYQQLIFCQNVSGNRSDALKSYEECARQLREQLGVEPSEDTTALYEQVKKSTAGSSQFSKSNLPIPLTSFIGREQELETLQTIFDTTRLLTLTGVGGCGKTRLSIQLATQLTSQFTDGVWWIELASIQDGNFLAPAIKKTLGIPDSQTISNEESITKYLLAKNILLVMDNCEHIISACVKITASILSLCPHVKILATSREALSIHGETAWLVPSLSLPPVGQAHDLMKWECPRLFFERATSYRSDLQLNESNSDSLLRICRTLEGIPLAIELAAARVKTLSLEQLASRLDDKLNLLTAGSRAAQPRQQTLRSTIDWSYELLFEQEKIVLQRLSVFYGTWTLDAAEFVCADDEVNSSTVLDLITHLLDKSLLVSEDDGGEIRYRMLEIVRQYAMEKLGETGNTEKIRDRHTQYYSELAQHVRPAWYTKEQALLIKQFNVHYPNIRVALGWAIENPDRVENWENGLKLAVSLSPYWIFLAGINEGQGWLQKAIDQINVVLAKPDSKSRNRTELLSIKAKMLYECGSLVWFMTKYELARKYFLESADIFREIKDISGVSYANMYLAHSTWVIGQKDLAREMLAQSLMHFKEAGDRWGTAMVYSFIGRFEREVENYEVARDAYERCFDLFSALGDDWGLGISLSHLGMLAFQNGNYRKARDLIEHRWNISNNIGLRHSLAYSSLLLGIVYWKFGDRLQVQRYMHDALMYFQQIGNLFSMADCLIGLAWVEAEAGHLEQAAYILGAIENANHIYWIRIGFEDLYFHKPLVADLQSRLGEQYQEAIERGRKSNLDDVAKELLAS